MWSQRSNLSERLPSIDEDISSGAVVFGNPEKKARPWDDEDDGDEAERSGDQPLALRPTGTADGEQGDGR